MDPDVQIIDEPEEGNVVPEEQEHCELLAYSFGWGWEAGIRLEEFVFADNYQAEEGNRVYSFNVMPNQQKIFRFPSYVGAHGYIDRRFQVQLEMGQKYILVCNPGDQWQFTCNGEEQQMPASVDVIVTSDIQSENNRTIFSHTIPIFVEENMFGVNLLCKPGCCYVIRTVNLDFPEEEALLDDHLALPQLPDYVDPVFNFQFYNYPMEAQTYYIIKTMGNIMDEGNLGHATLRLTLGL